MFSVVILALTTMSTLILEINALTLLDHDSVNETTTIENTEHESVGDDQTSEPQKHDSRKFFEWLTNLINGRLIKNTNNTATYTNTSHGLMSSNAQNSIILNQQDSTDEVTLKAVLVNLTQVLEKLNKNIELQLMLHHAARSQFYYPKRTYEPEPQFTRGKREDSRRQKEGHRRSKREVPYIPDFGSLNSLLAGTELPREPINFQPITTPTKAPTPSENNLEVLTRKFLVYLNKTYNDMQKKIAPIQHLKDVNSQSDLYKIGYITANIDILEANVRTLKSYLDENSTKLTDVKIVDLFEKLSSANNIVNNLADSLIIYQKRNGFTEIK